MVHPACNRQRRLQTHTARLRMNCRDCATARLLNSDKNHPEKEKQQTTDSNMVTGRVISQAMPMEATVFF